MQLCVSRQHRSYAVCTPPHQLPRNIVLGAGRREGCRLVRLADLPSMLMYPGNDHEIPCYFSLYLMIIMVIDFGAFLGEDWT